MNRFSRFAGSAVMGLTALAATAMAGDSSNRALAPGGHRGHRARQFDRCLATAGLSADQQAAIDAIRSDARTSLEADLAALKAAREKLQADLAGGADKTVLGQDLLDQDAAAEKLKSDRKATQDLIVSQLEPQQQTTVESCMQTRRGRGEAAPGPSQ
jgi:Spy/CpxP family protein refolding chaperone